jgi:hypothetical protein
MLEVLHSQLTLQQLCRLSKFTGSSLQPSILRVLPQHCEKRICAWRWWHIDITVLIAVVGVLKCVCIGFAHNLIVDV